MSTHNATAAFPIRTPVTYLNYLHPGDVAVYEISRNIFLAIVGAAVMELLESLPADISIYKMGVNPTMLAYSLTRPAAILFGLLAIIAKSPNGTNCQALILGEFVCCFVAMTTSSFLFLRRVQAVWKGNKIVSVIFSLIWLTGVAWDALLFSVTQSGPLADTGYCIITSLKGPWGAGAPIVSLVFDTLVFFSISYKVATEFNEGAANNTTRVTWSTLMSGKALPRLARSILRGGQQYYLIAVIANLFLVVFMSFPLTSFELAVAPTPVAIIIISGSACRVFRNLKLAALRSTEVFEATTKSIRFGLPQHNAVRHQRGLVVGGAGSSSTYLSQSTTDPTATATHTYNGMGATVLALDNVGSTPELGVKKA